MNIEIKLNSEKKNWRVSRNFIAQASKCFFFCVQRGSSVADLYVCAYTNKFSGLMPVKNWSAEGGVAIVPFYCYTIPQLLIAIGAEKSQNRWKTSM